MTIYSHSKRPESSKYVSFICKIEPPEFAQLEPSLKAPEARFVGVAQRLQNKRKSTNKTIYSHPKRPESSKYVSFISKIEQPEFAQLEPSPKAPEARFVGVAQRLQNNRKSIKITIYSHPKIPESLKNVSFISKFEPPEFAQLEPSRKAQ